MTAAERAQRQKILAGVLGVCALGGVVYLYEELFGGTTTPPPPPPVIRDASGAVATTAASARAPMAGVAAKTAAKVGTSAQALDPTLHMAAMLRTEALVYSGSGRNIFAAGPSIAEASIFIPKPIGGGRNQMPIPPPPHPTVAAYQAPPINLKFFGTVTSPNGTRRAFLVNGDNVFIASAGDVVERRYRILSISANSISVEDMPNNNRQTLPLLSN
jgi:hypothetical protein